MPPTTVHRDRSSSVSSRSSPNPGVTARPTTRRNGPPTLIEEEQDIKGSQNGRKFLKKHLLLCPAGKPPTHLSLSTCLHQISEMPGVPKQTINAIRSVAFLLEEMEDTQIHESLRTALDTQMTEFTSDMKVLVEDAKEKINENIKAAEERLNSIQVPMSTQQRYPKGSYASALVNPPAHANPRVAAREGIKARQFLIEGVNNSKFSHLDNLQLKTEINKTLTGLDPSAGRVRSVTKTRGGRIII